VEAKVINFRNQGFNRMLVIILHLVAVGIFISLPFMLVGPRGSNRPSPPASENYRPPPRHERDLQQFSDGDFHSVRIQSVLFNAVLICFFYTNMYVLVPGVLTKKSWVYYVGAIALSFAVVFLLNELISHWLSAGEFRPGRPVYFTVINFLLVFGLSTALRLTSDRVKFERERKESETENLKSELALLRSQVSPHFMFNVLNNLASLARKKSDQLEPVIIQLSHLMRYMLYDAGEKRVTVQKEIEYLTSYIDLQKLRFGNDITIHFNTSVSRDDIPIEPMLLIPFVENAFKHGIGMIMEPLIMINLSTEGNTLHFSVKNKFASNQETKDPSSGIGIQNVRRRLELLYKDLHEMKTSATDGWFIVDLKLILK
jgi:two-component system LytT family sensor kinase